MKTYFFDTYALMEIIVANPKYKEFLDVGVIISRLNLMELYYGLLTKYGLDFAEKQLNFFKEYAFEFDDGTMKEAMELKARFRKSNLSYVDCLGYIMAKQRNIPFLTGDKEFKGFENVRFVK